MTTRWFLTATSVLVLAATAVAGCGDDAPTPAPPPASATPSAGASSVAASSVAPPGDDSDADPGSAAFVAAVREALPQIATDRRDEEIALIAEQACAGVSGGLTADQVIAETRTLGTDAAATDPATARELIKLAIDKVCVDQAARADDF
jgi:hypothetical protein